MQYNPQHPLASDPINIANWVRLCVCALIVIGVGARLSPLADIDGRLFWQYMTEDGYLMQTVARNMAIGLGMSTAEGTIATNGVQPLATYLFAGLHFIAQGDKALAIVLITLVSTLIALAGAWLLARVANAVFVFSFGMIVGAISMLPGGLGSTEATMVLLLTALGVDLDMALLATAIVRATTFWFAVVIGLIVAPSAVAASRRAANNPSPAFLHMKDAT